MEVVEIIERAKKKADLPSDYALAKAIGIERQVISQWRGGKRHPSNEEAVQLATLAGLDEMQVIAEIELRTAKNEKKKAFWQHYIENRSITACIAMTTLAIGIIATPEPASANVLQLQNYDENKTIIYIMRIKYKLLILKALILKYKQCATLTHEKYFRPAIS